MQNATVIHPSYQRYPNLSCTSDCVSVSMQHWAIADGGQGKFRSHQYQSPVHFLSEECQPYSKG